MELSLPIKTKVVQSFLGKINFVSKFISNFSRMIHPIKLMLKKDMNLKWTTEDHQSFEEIKREITFTPILRNPKFSKYFILYIYRSKHSVTFMLTQREES